MKISSLECWPYIEFFLLAGNARLLSCSATRATEGTEYENFPHAQTMASFPPAAHDLFDFDQLLSEEERDVKYRTRAFMVLSSAFDLLNPSVRVEKSS